MATGSGLSTNFPPVPTEYDPAFMVAVRDFMEELANAAYLKTQHVDVNLPDNAGTREAYLIVRSPDGTPWALEADNAGTLTPRDVSGELP